MDLILAEQGGSRKSRYTSIKLPWRVVIAVGVMETWETNSRPQVTCSAIRRAIPYIEDVYNPKHEFVCNQPLAVVSRIPIFTVPMRKFYNSAIWDLPIADVASD
jgi:hypothetical protein